jgi:TonB family protein
MKQNFRKPFLVPVLLILAFLVLAAEPAIAAEQELLTQVSLLIGRPSGDSSEGVLVVPGTAIASPRVTPLRKAEIDSEVAQGIRLAKLASDLKKTLRLADVEVRYRQAVALKVDAETDLWAPSEGSHIRMTIKLLGLNDDAALYEVKMSKGSKILAESRVHAKRGERAIVGGLDGDEAPYLFLVVEPVSKDNAVPINPSTMVSPRVISRTPPVYPAEARAAGVGGVVIVNGSIDTNGVFQNAKVLRSLPMGLDQAALDAIEQWRFTPATTLEGEPIEVIFNLTVTFKVDAKE